MRARMLAAIMSVLAPCIAHAQPNETLQGYGPFRFGMSAEQAMAAAPSADWHRNEFTSGREMLTAPPIVPVGGLLFSPMLHINEGRLDEIGLRTGGPLDNANACTGVMRRVVYALEDDIGALAGAPMPSEYGLALPEIMTARGSKIRLYDYPAAGEHWTFANLQAGGFVEVVSQYAAEPLSNYPNCVIEMSFRSAPPVLQQRLPAPSLAELDGAQMIENPEWLDRPDSRAHEINVPSIAVKRHVNGDVLLDCLVREEGRLACMVAEEESPGWHWGEAALNLGAYYRIAPQIDGASTFGKRVRVPIIVGTGPMPTDATGPADDERVEAYMAELRELAENPPQRAALDAATLLEDPQFTARPDGPTFVRYYPPTALNRGIGGQVVLECLIVAEGALHCAITDESPEGYDFGLASLGIARSFRVEPIVNGEPTIGKRVRIPITFRLN